MGAAWPNENHNGFPNVVHGGVLATYFDEVLWLQTKREDESVNAVTLEMSIHYWSYCAEKSELRIVACPAEIDGRHYYVNGAIILPDDTVCTTARVHYLRIRDSSDVAKREVVRVMHSWESDRETIRF